MFSLERIGNVEDFIESIMRARDDMFLKEIGRLVDICLDKNEEELYLNGTIWDVFDIRDAIILRISQLKRMYTMQKYLYAETSSPS